MDDFKELEEQTEKEVVEELEDKKDEELSLEEKSSIDKKSSIDDLEDELEGKVKEEEPLTEDELEDALEGKNVSVAEEDTPMESIVEVETLYNFRTLKYTNMYVIRVKRRSTIISLILTIVTFGIAIALLVYGLINKAVSNYWISGLIFLLGCWTLFNVLTEEKKIDKQLKKYFTTHQPFTQKFLINHDKVRVEVTTDGETRRGDYPWAYVQSIDMTKEYIFLFTNNGAPLVIDRKESAILKGDAQTLDELIKEEASLKPFKFYDKPVCKHLDDIDYPVTIEDETKE